MGFRLFRRMRIAPGVTLNLSRSGLSTGMYYTTAQGTGKKRTSSRTSQARGAPAAAPGPPASLDLGFFQRLTTPDNEKAFVEGCKELVNDAPEKALEHFNASQGLADAAFMGGIIAFKLERFKEAAERLNEALNLQNQLGKLLNKYGLEAGANIAITDEITAFVGADRRGALLAQTEVYQHMDRPDYALQCVYRLRKLEPDDLLIGLSLVELYFDTGKTNKNQLKAIVNLTQDIENESAIHGALLLYRARAMRLLGLPDAAREVLTKALRRRKDRPAELLLALRYERALVYAELEKILKKFMPKTRASRMSR